MAQTKRRVSDPTHPTVWAGLVLAFVGLLIAVYAYTGSRVYDIMFFFIALLGGLLAFVGILTSAWGRALGASRMRRARMAAKGAAMAPKTVDRATTETGEPLPTVAEPPTKKSFKERFALQKKEKAAKPKTDGKPVFAFKRREAPPTPGPDAAAEAAGAPESAALEPAAATDAAPATPAAAAESGAVARIKLQCPRCATQFSAEGVRPIRAVCPKCAYAADV